MPSVRKTFQPEMRFLSLALATGVPAGNPLTGNVNTIPLSGLFNNGPDVDVPFQLPGAFPVNSVSVTEDGLYLVTLCLNGTNDAAATWAAGHVPRADVLVTDPQNGPSNGSNIVQSFKDAASAAIRTNINGAVFVSAGTSFTVQMNNDQSAGAMPNVTGGYLAIVQLGRSFPIT